MTEPAPAPAAPMATMKALELLEGRVALLESLVKDQALEIARHRVALEKPAPAAPKGRLLRDR